MATRSMIGIEQADGTIKGIYCHYDGYPSGVGKTLMEKWNTREAAEALIELGDISQLGDGLQDTVAYHRDRGEDWEGCNPEIYSGIRQFNCQEYAYVWKRDDKWMLYVNRDS